MTQKNDGGPAFPTDMLISGSVTGSKPYSGMSLRDWFAGQAMVGITAGYWSNPDMSGVGPQGMADEAYQYADAMIAARGDRMTNYLYGAIITALLLAIVSYAAGLGDLQAIANAVRP